jgi:CII-binding regulator of phage lambda lysogenization HflD
MFNIFKDERYVKVTKENWSKIENLFEQKEKKIREQEYIINEQKLKISNMMETTNKLIKYKENDDLLFAYENQAKSDAKKIKALNEKVSQLEENLKQADKKVSSVLALEKAYLQKIISTENELRRSSRSCPDYETQGDELINIYA